MIKSALHSSLVEDIKYNSMSAGNAPSSEYLISTTLITSNTPSITFDNLAQFAGVYKHLQIVFTARVSYTAFNRSDLAMRANGDNGTNYSYNALTSTGSGSPASGGEGSTNFMYFASISSNSDASGSYNAGFIDILDPYSSTKNKTFRGLAGRAGVVPYAIGLYSSLWRNTAPISSLTLFDLNSTNFVPGSRFSLYGVTA